MDSLLGTSLRQPSCKDIPRFRPDNAIDEATLKSFTEDYRVFPLFEQRIYNLTQKKAYSMVSNEKMRCQWKEYVLRDSAVRKRPPFHLKAARDYHFYNCINRYVPSESSNGKARRMHLRNDLADSLGSIPIAQERLMRRSRPKQEIQKRVT